VAQKYDLPPGAGYPNYATTIIVAFLDKALYDGYLCLMVSNK